jgi:hypothetical protein
MKSPTKKLQNILFYTSITIIVGLSIQTTFNTFEITTVANSKGPSCTAIPTQFSARYFAAIHSFKSYSSADYTPPVNNDPANPNLQDEVKSLCDDATPCSPNCCENAFCPGYHTFNGDKIIPDHVYTVVIGGVIGNNNFIECLDNSTTNVCA